MVKILVLVMVVFLFSGCSVVKWATQPFKNTVSNVPQTINKLRTKAMCQGETKFNDQGEIIYCSKGYFKYNENNSIKERTLTVKEKIIQLLNNLMGWSFWIVLGLLFLCPSILGVIAGRLFEGIYGMGAKAFKQVSAAIQKVKDTTPTLVDALEKSTDTDVRAWIDNFKKVNGIK